MSSSPDNYKGIPIQDLRALAAFKDGTIAILENTNAFRQQEIDSLKRQLKRTEDEVAMLDSAADKNYDEAVNLKLELDAVERENVALRAKVNEQSLAIEGMADSNTWLDGRCTRLEREAKANSDKNRTLLADATFLRQRVKSLEDQLANEQASLVQTHKYYEGLTDEAEALRNNEPGIWSLSKDELVKTINRLRGLDGNAPEYAFIQLDRECGGLTPKAYTYNTGGLHLLPGDRVRVPVKSFKKSGSYARTDNVITGTVKRTSAYPDSYGDFKTVLGLADDNKTVTTSITNRIQMLEEALDRQNKWLLEAWNDAGLNQSKLDLLNKALDKWSNNGVYNVLPSYNTARINWLLETFYFSEDN